MGLLSIAQPDELRRKLEDLRRAILEDPYFKDVPSIQQAQAKTAVGFHAKDDLPEVRKTVFDLLKNEEVKFSAVVKRKHTVLKYVRSRNTYGYRYTGDDLYDFMVRNLFRQRLHTHTNYEITFAMRGSRSRTEALERALYSARRNFAEKHAIDSLSSIQVMATPCRKDPCLQAVDYFLWALQRAYEKREDRFISLLWPRVNLVWDLDHPNSTKGVCFRSNLPITVAELQLG